MIVQLNKEESQMKQSNLRARFIKPSMDPRKLQHFLSVYDAGSFSRAAIQDGVSQQAVSKSVAKLEEALGVKLFERGAFGAEPTNFAQVLARRAKVIAAESRLAAAEISALRGADKGYVRIGLSWSFIPRIAPILVNHFRERQPGVTLSIATGDTRALHDQLLRGELEFVASAPSPEVEIDDTLETFELFEERDELIMRKNHPFADRVDISLEEYSSQTWLVAMRLSERWRRICGIFLSSGIDPPATYVDVDSIALIKSLILQSDGIALFAKELVAQPHEEKLFHFIEDSQFSFVRTAIFSTRKSSSPQPLAHSLRNDLISISREAIDPHFHRGLLLNPM